MEMKELLLKSDSIHTDVVSARDQREDFAIVVEGKQALKLFRVVPSYECFRDSLRERVPGWRWRAWSFFFRALLTNMSFWAFCTQADFDARRTEFIYENGILKAKFYFHLPQRIP